MLVALIGRYGKVRVGTETLLIGSSGSSGERLRLFVAFSVLISFL